MTAIPPIVTLSYSIAGSSEHSGKYGPENIKVDNPQDQTSRWSGAHQTSEVQQWLLLRLETLAVLKSITFGKFYKRHPCNMKEFKVYIGLTEDNMMEVLHGSLRDDASPETFSIRSTNTSGNLLPSRFVRIEPLSAYGQHFHTSIWYMALRGIDDEAYVEAAREAYEEYQERVVLRHVLKYLRRRRFLQPFQAILSRTPLQLEHPLITKLYTTLVLQGDFAGAESLLPSIVSTGLFNSSLLASQVYASWNRILAMDADGSTPSARGGHAMCMDIRNGVIYLFGGWDGQKNLDDFWVYDIKKDQWNMIHRATARDRNEPGPRSCHKMVFDSSTGCIYLLGKLDDTEVPMSPRASPEVPSTPRTGSSSSDTISISKASTLSAHAAELYRYHTRGPAAGKWDMLSPDTTVMGGPPLIFDHQMVIDPDAQMIYVSGGRVIDGDFETIKYSGIYSYDICANKWTAFQSSDLSVHPNIPSRYGHSMVLDSKRQTLFIFGGQRDDQYLADMYALHIPTHTVTELFPNFSVAGGPDACFTQRAVIDPELREIYVFCGLTRHRPASPHTMVERTSPYWIYRYDRSERPGRWAKILEPSSTAEGSPSLSPSSISERPCPVPRYAHQVVYNPITKTAYLHGGNACLEGEVVMDIRDSDGSTRDGNGDRSDDVASPKQIYREKVETLPEASDDSITSHLSDFWSMQLVRPSPDEIARRCRYLIRQQKFRELCAEAPAIKALNYLQTEVSAVVDHSDDEETRLFRSLLAHLLAPPQPGSGKSSVSDKRPARLQPPAETYPPEEGSPMKIVPTEMETSGNFHVEEEDEYMRVDRRAMQEDVAADSGGGESLRSPVSMEEDLVEREVNGGKPASPERYKERTAVFEQLMAFVNKDAKQPDKDLFSMVNSDQGDF